MNGERMTRSTTATRDVRVELSSPWGVLVIEGDEAGITRIGLPNDVGFHRSRAVVSDLDSDHPVARAHAALVRYFAGEPEAFEAIPLEPKGTEFQRAVWRRTRAIPAGETESYAEIARAIGRPKAVRAVGQANARNPIPIIVPCHRVIGSSGRLTGYRGGLTLKQGLLDLERATSRSLQM